MKKFIKGILNVLLISGIVALTALGIREVLYVEEVKRENDSLKEGVVDVPVNNGSDEDYLDPNDPFNRHVDFEYLQSVNPDIVGWIYLPGTEIDYPILQGDGDETYLRADFNRNYSVLGSIFMYADADMLNDYHNLVFGHNTTNGVMFGSIRQYSTKDFADSHKKVYIYTPERTKECDLISAFKCYYTDEVFEVSGKALEDELDTLQASLISRSLYSMEIPENIGQVWTLSTCDGFHTTNRFVANFAVTKEKYVLD